MRQVNGSALIMAGLLSAVLFPWIAQALLGGKDAATSDAPDGPMAPYEENLAAESTEAL